jgi:methylphosphotriester-DNA--protein-cysteine methyltransferase
MLRHHLTDDRTVRSLIRSGAIAWAGNAALGIYGRLDCKSGRRMGRRNRVFFGSDSEARESGFRPCGNCLRQEYREWKKTRDLA